ncbi:hypothetical protein mRhiFer1_008463 [Rhinolophus ferrumequinum]|uniref:UBA domain-containing protein n=1 Tax=Rhinolophus ferrumequinum TaxID=59479 RepID=A0A7J7V8G1_RHIFE|nr:hypothetical protein mRhiFer1_008463 [Rhinolophus ferrumequinum]
MGFERHEIQNALTQKTYNNVTATYLMLNTKKARVQCRKIRVRPYRSTDIISLDRSPDQEAQTERQPNEQESGQKAEESAGPSASPRSRKASLQPSANWRKVTPRHSPKLRTTTARASPKSRTATPRTSRKARTANPPPNPESESKTITPPPNPESKNATPSPAPQCGPGDTPSTHTTNSSRSSSGSPEGKSRDQQGVARRCLHFLRKLCLRPFKGLGKHNRVKPS